MAEETRQRWTRALHTEDRSLRYLTKGSFYCPGVPSSYIVMWSITVSFLKQGTPALPQSSIAADLLKGTITKLATEDLSSPDKGRGEQLVKGHVIYEGKSGHIRSYDRMCYSYLFKKTVLSVIYQAGKLKKNQKHFLLSKSYKELQGKHS